MNTKKWFLDWQFENYEKEFLLGAVIPPLQQQQQQQLQLSLLQNCDLPPPVKYFSPTEFEDCKTKLKETISVSTTLPSKIPDKNCKNNQFEENENPGLLRALQLSQTRAREAEKKASMESARNKQMTDMIFKESMKLYAHRQWVKLLDIEISTLNKRSHRSNEIPVEGDIPLTAWFLTVALCVGIAGVGFAFGCCLF